MIIAAIPAAAADSISTGRSYLVSQTKASDFEARKGVGSVSDDVLVRAIHDGRGFDGTAVDLPAWTQGFEDNGLKDAVACARSLCTELSRLDASCAVKFGCERLDQR